MCFRLPLGVTTISWFVRSSDSMLVFARYFFRASFCIVESLRFASSAPTFLSMKNPISSFIDGSTSIFSSSISMRWWFATVSVRKNALLRGNKDRDATLLGDMKVESVWARVSMSTYLSS